MTDVFEVRLSSAGFFALRSVLAAVAFAERVRVYPLA